MCRKSEIIALKVTAAHGKEKGKVNIFSRFFELGLDCGLFHMVFSFRKLFP